MVLEWFVHSRRPRMSTTTRSTLATALLFLTTAVGCAHNDYYPGTTILRNEDNQKIIETVESYRRRLMEHNVEGLLILASPKYFEDSGTPRSDDDYGFEGLKQVLTSKLKRVKSLRYEIEYRTIRVRGNAPRSKSFSTARSSSRPTLVIATGASTTTTASCSNRKTISGSSPAECEPPSRRR